jgi:protein SCO1
MTPQATARRPRGLLRPAAGLAPLTGCAVLLAGCAAGHPATPSNPATKPATSVTVPSATSAGVTGILGLQVRPVPREPDFTLTDTAGRPYRLTTATTGRLVYLYFGYTHCPDVCPTTMADLAAALRQAPATIRARVTVVFVTVDPARDTRRVLRAWLDNFDPAFVGLTGTPAQIQAAEQASGEPLAQPEPDPTLGYGIQHSAEVFAYSPDRLAHAVYAEGYTPAQYAHDMPLLLRLLGAGLRVHRVEYIGHAVVISASCRAGPEPARDRRPGL